MDDRTLLLEPRQSMVQIDQMLYRYPRVVPFFSPHPVNHGESYPDQRRSHIHAPRLYLQRYWRRLCQSQPPSQFRGGRHSIDWGIAYSLRPSLSH